MSPRLKTSIAISALLRRAQGAGAYAAILRKGDDVAGAYMVCVRQDQAMILYLAERNMMGEVSWFPKGPLTETEAMAFINRRVDMDPDLWVIEIEDARGRNFLDEPKGAQNKESKNDAALAAAEALFRGPKPRR